MKVNTRILFTFNFFLEEAQTICVCFVQAVHSLARLGCANSAHPASLPEMLVLDVISLNKFGM